MKILYALFLTLFLIQNISLVFGQFNIGIKSPIIICSGNEIRCSSDKTKITQCNFDGTEFSNVIETCNVGEECQSVGSTLDCVKKPFFRMENLPFFPLISLILAIIIMILWYALAKNRIRKYWKKK